MDKLGKIGNLIDGLYNELNTRMQVLDIVTKIVHAVDIIAVEERCIAYSNDLTTSRDYCRWLLKKLHSSISHQHQLEHGIQSTKFKAEEIREKVVLDIGYILREGKKVNKMYQKIQYLDSKLHETSTALDELRLNGNIIVAGDALSSTAGGDVENNQLKQPQPIIDGTIDGKNDLTTKDNSIAPRIALVSVFHDLEDEHLLYVFSFLDTPDVLSSCQVCKYVYARVYALFGIDSQFVRPEWLTKGQLSIESSQSQSAILPEVAVAVVAGTLPSSASTTSTSSVSFSSSTSSVASSIHQTTITAVPASNSSSSAATAALGAAPAIATQTQPTVFLTRELADTLSKKLTATELKVIINMTDRLKKQAATIESITAEKEDVIAKLQNTETVRDFLVEKLRSAELALKSALSDNNHLKKQAVADSEVISYLDIRGQELEGVNANLLHEGEHLRRTVDLQLKSHAALEERLTAELKHYKQRNEELESSHKSQKKLLVKEVKSLRSHVESLSSERNMYHSQLETLRNALNSGIGGTTNSSSSNSNSNTVGYSYGGGYNGSAAQRKKSLS